MEDLTEIKESFLGDLKGVDNLQQLKELKARYLGKKGVLTSQLKGLSKLPPQERPLFGKKINEIKAFIETEIEKKTAGLKEVEIQRKLLEESIDITLPGRYIPPGKSHPVSQVLQEIIEIFRSMGFGVEEGPEVELDYYNFEALNIPKEHPARDMQDTFYINTGEQGAVVESDVVLRTHTSPVQIRVMERRKPPFR
ncbi:MAG: phenylalanine--tRNA ligase subunit alpha, partial [Nitrospirae bacterium]